MDADGYAGEPRRKKKRGGIELLIAFGAIALLGVIALTLYVIGEQKRRAAAGRAAAQEAILQRNMALAGGTYAQAESAGMLFVMGKDPGATNETLFGPFRTNEAVWNVIYDRNYKEGRPPALRTEQRAMFPDRLRFDKVEHTREDNGVRLNYAFADNMATPVVIASKAIKGADGDTANPGGVITVVVKAENDDRFENAKRKKAEKAAEPAATK
ncbi:MAG: hypothetical protein NTW87_15475 [Planctomycetota bacterium]|nr:hypothetical protein [Planctomycetota bacterium]